MSTVGNKLRDNLIHAGVKGMRWGIRRYQNEDGSLTDLGRARLRANPSVDFKKTVEEDLKSTNKILSDGKKGTDAISEYVSGYKPEVKRLDLSSMTDKELSDRIKREQLEKQYDQMFNTRRREMEAGRDEITRLTKGLSTALTTTASVLGIALAIKQLRNG